MSKKLEEMTVDELINLEHHSSCRCDVDIIDYIRCELIRRARQAEQQPKWRLTQILIELERAGIEEYQPDTAFIFRHSSGKQFAYDFLENKIGVVISENIYSKNYKWSKFETFEECIEKLKELLCGN